MRRNKASINLFGSGCGPCRWAINKNIIFSLLLLLFIYFIALGYLSPIKTRELANSDRTELDRSRIEKIENVQKLLYIFVPRLNQNHIYLIQSDLFLIDNNNNGITAVEMYIYESMYRQRISRI